MIRTISFFALTTIIPSTIACVTVPRGWHDICWVDDTEVIRKSVCIVSNAFCENEGQLGSLLRGDGGHDPTAKAPLEILLDTRDWSGEIVCETGADFTTCLAAVNGTTHAVAAKSIHTVQGGMSSINYFTVKPWPGTLSKFSMTAASVKQVAGFGAPLCRAFTFFGHHVTIEDAEIDVRNCLGFYDTPGQYRAEDGVVISIENSAAGSVFKNVKWIATRDVSGVDVVGLRIGNSKASVDVDGLEITGINTKGVDTAVAIWDGIGAWKFSAGDCDDGVGCLVWYHAPEASQLSLGDSGKWTAVNVTAALPVGAVHVPGAVKPSIFETPAACSAWGHLAVILLVLAIIISLVAVIYLCRHAIHDQWIKHLQTNATKGKGGSGDGNGDAMEMKKMGRRSKETE